MLNQIFQNTAFIIVIIATLVIRSGMTYAEGAVSIELNKLESRESGCHAYLVSHNQTPENFTELIVDLVIFRSDGIIERVIGVSLAPLPTTKTGVKVFNLQLACNQIGRLLINDVTECRTNQDMHSGCLDLLSPSSRASAELIK